MRNCRTIDIEDALQAYLNAEDVTAYAPPVPPTLCAGCVVVWRTGGTERAYVQDVHSVSVDCYGETPADAMQRANSVCAIVRGLEGATLGGVPVYESTIMTLPYSNPDPDRYDLARATFAAQLVTRTIHD